MLQKIQLLFSILRLAKNPQQTDEVFVQVKKAISTLPASEREAIITDLLEYPGFQQRYDEHHKLMKLSYDVAALGMLPKHTLGHQYALHMQNNGLSPDFYEKVDITDPLTFTQYRLSQIHDILHVVTGCTTSVVDEIKLQAFSVGQIPRYINVIIIGGLLHTLYTANSEMSGQMIEGISDGFAMGKAAQPILFLPWEEMWEEDLEDLRARYSIAVS